MIHPVPLRSAIYAIYADWPSRVRKSASICQVSASTEPKILAMLRFCCNVCRVPRVSRFTSWCVGSETLGGNGRTSRKKKRQMFSKIWSLRKQLRSCLKEAAPATSGEISPSPHKFGRHAQLNVRSRTIKGLPPASQAHPKPIFQPYPLCLNMLNPTKIQKKISKAKASAKCPASSSPSAATSMPPASWRAPHPSAAARKAPPRDAPPGPEKTRQLPSRLLRGWGPTRLALP